ncbi:MAG TPA: alcohol dehydrogenase catalytic domain-containing protein [Dissulfurispiraceae bacterium]|nr:alcohol dehydrogenase catalytic domain-containing protein [Dissulfurispiraceae bacterium]
MKVAKLYSFNDIRIEEQPIPAIGHADALVRTEACGICSGDVMPWYIEKKAPLVIGHEPAGIIEDIGNDYIGPLKKGDRVAIHHHAPCMLCDYCRRGDHVQCETWRKTGIIPGGVSEFIAVPEINLKNDTLKVPAGMGPEDATLVEPAACVVKSFKRSSIKQGDTVLVIGLGVMGQMHVLMAHKFGASRVIGADMVDFRLSKAIEFGANHAIDVSKDDLLSAVRELTGGVMAQIVIAGPNSIEAMQQGIKAVARGGTVVFFTPAKPGDILAVDPNDIYFKDIRIITSYSCGPDDTKEAMRLIREGVITADKLVTHRFRIDETARAYNLTANAKESLKSLVVF